MSRELSVLKERSDKHTGKCMRADHSPQDFAMRRSWWERLQHVRIVIRMVQLREEIWVI